MIRRFYTFGEPDAAEPGGLDCVADYGATIDEALAHNAADRQEAEDDLEDPEYFDKLKLFRITVEEIEWTPKAAYPTEPRGTTSQR